MHYILTGERSGAAAYLSPDEEWLLRTWEALTPRQRSAWRDLLGEPPSVREPPAIHEDPAPPYPADTHREPGE